MGGGPSIARGLRAWWRDAVKHYGLVGAARQFCSESWYLLRDSTPSRRRQRYGDIDFDWDHRVDTTSAGAGWRTRVRGALAGSLYQPIEPALFHAMVAGLAIDYRQFTFIDIGSGKARALLMAAEYPFRRIVGVEVLPELHRIAEENVRSYANPRQQCRAIELVCADAEQFAFPPEPSVVYLFHPLHPPALARLVSRLEESVRKSPRPIFIVYANPLEERLLARSGVFRKVDGTQQYCVYRNG